MFYRLAALVLVVLTAGCGTVAAPIVMTATPDLYAPRIPIPRSALAVRVRQTVAPYPYADWCDKGVSRQPIEDYNTSLAQALADLLAAPEAAALSDSQLSTIFVDGAQPHVPVFKLVSGGDWLLATLPTYYEYCAMGSHYVPAITRILMFDRAGHWQTIKTISTNSEMGTFIFAEGAVQWAGDRWVVMLNDLNTIGFTGFEVVHILREGDTWVVKTALKAEGKDLGYLAPTMRLVDGYKAIALTSNQYSSKAPCTFDAATQDRYAWTYYTVEQPYQWDGAAYIPAAEQIIETKVILYAGKQRETYERLVDWQAHCIS